MSEQRTNEYTEGKYGKLGVDRVWHNTAIPFDEVISHFEAWMSEHRLWGKGSRECLANAAFVTWRKSLNNASIKDESPPLFYGMDKREGRLSELLQEEGMVTMMRELKIPLLRSHHLEIDDTKNITRVVQRMLTDGALLQITARRSPGNLENVEFLFINRIR